MRIGIDVGGTNTDAVAYDAGRVLAAHKVATSTDIVGGLVGALQALKRDGLAEAADALVIGTTQMTNALVSRSRLHHVGILRIGLPAAIGLPPLVGWPRDLVEAIGAEVVMVTGGHEVDGRRIAPLDEQAIKDAGQRFRRLGIQTIAISAIFSPILAVDERRAAVLLRDILPQASITLSSDLGTIGLLERENAAILNAALIGVANHVVSGFELALAELGLRQRVFLTQNDGTLLDGATARKFPVMTFASGPTNSLRGAAQLSGVTDAIVVDVGGTTSDIGTLVDGYPRLAAAAVDVGGVRTNFRMPDILSVAVGGGSLVGGTADHATVGPASVGHELPARALCFGGDTLTATDIAVASGRVALGDPAGLAHLDRSFVDAAMTEIGLRIGGATDAVKTSRGAVPLVVVGGGGFLVGDDVPGVAKTLRPRHGEVANAVGAAAAQMGFTLDTIAAIDGGARREVMARLRAEAVAGALAAGAVDPRVHSVEETPVPYAADGTTRFRIRAIGELHLPAVRPARVA